MHQPKSLYINHAVIQMSEMFVCLFKGRITPLPHELNSYLQSSLVRSGHLLTHKRALMRLIKRRAHYAAAKVLIYKSFCQMSEISLLTQRKRNGNKLKPKCPDLNPFLRKPDPIGPFLILRAKPTHLNLKIGPKFGLNPQKTGQVWPH